MGIGLQQYRGVPVCCCAFDSSLCIVSGVVDKHSGSARSVLAGGCVPGWSPEVAVVLWRRILGCLGNVNDIRDAGIHEEVYEYLCDLVCTLVKVQLTRH